MSDTENDPRLSGDDISHRYLKAVATSSDLWTVSLDSLTYEVYCIPNYFMDTIIYIQAPPNTRVQFHMQPSNSTLMVSMMYCYRSLGTEYSVRTRRIFGFKAEEG
jgi:hypothetical protein